MVAIGLRCLHTSKRMHFIEDPPFGPSRLAAVFLHTSKRMHFIEEHKKLPPAQWRDLAYVKTYALH